MKAVGEKQPETCKNVGIYHHLLTIVRIYFTHQVFLSASLYSMLLKAPLASRRYFVFFVSLKREFALPGIERGYIVTDKL